MHCYVKMLSKMLQVIFLLTFIIDKCILHNEDIQFLIKKHIVPKAHVMVSLDMLLGSMHCIAQASLGVMA